MQEMENNMAKVILKKGEGRTVKNGGAWVYDNEIDRVDGNFRNGEIVTVLDFDGFEMGKGFISTESTIRVRMLTRKQGCEIDDAFISMRVKSAWEYRKTVMERDALNCCRVIFGEADWLPGLVVDKYDDVLVTESLAIGMETEFTGNGDTETGYTGNGGDTDAGTKTVSPEQNGVIEEKNKMSLKEKVLEKLIEFMKNDGFPVRMVYERSDAQVRRKEGLTPFKGLIWTVEEGFVRKKHERRGTDFSSAEVPRVEIVENGVHYLVDVVNGQKTGFFLDQKYNRLAMQRICRGKRVLDCFTHMGTFALNAGIAGAADVTGLDISEFAIAQAEENARLNHLEDTVKFRCANVLDELPRLYDAGERYDVVILDPPAFTKSREATKNAIKGYREINMKGLKLVKDGGYLASCSCSHFMTQELLFTTISQAAKSVHKRLRQVEFRTQSCDHPILWSADESYYLKFYIFQVCDEK